MLYGGQKVVAGSSESTRYEYMSTIWYHDIPGSSKKTAIQHNMSHRPQSSLCPPLLNVACVLHAAETQMAVFFEALPAQVRNATLKLGAGGFLKC